MRVLIISYSFPPDAVGAAVVMHNLCKHLPRASYSVITVSGEVSLGLGVCDNAYKLNCNVVRLPVYSHTRRDNYKFLLLTVLKGMLLDKKIKFDCYLAVFPKIYDLLGAYVLHKLTRKPFVIYMHDLFTENLGSVHKLERFFWEFLEAKLFSATSKILVMNEKVTEHYLRRGISNLAVIPPSISLDQNNRSTTVESMHFPKENLRIVFTGSVGGAQESAVLAFLKAIEKMSDVEVLFATPSKKDYLKEVSVGFLPRRKCIELQRSADILFLPLSSTFSSIEEVRCAIPSKTLEYLAAGKPILAVVPKGSFVEEFVKKHEVGIVVTDLSAEKITHAIEELRDEEKRKRFSQNSLKTARLFDSKIVSRQLYSLLEGIISDVRAS